MKLGIVLVGASGSGKSSAIEQIVNLFPEEDVRVFSLDMCRLNLAKTDDYSVAFEYVENNPSDFNALVNEAWAEALLGDVVIVDNTNISSKSRNRWLTDIRRKGGKTVAIQLFTPMQTVIDRQKFRTDKSVPENVVRHMYMHTSEVMLGSEVEHLINIDGTNKAAAQKALYSLRSI